MINQITPCARNGTFSTLEKKIKAELIKIGTENQIQSAKVFKVTLCRIIQVRSPLNNDV
tara:strand:- start:210 stop:386 length:177 start_codon:yes stop_codon:yes gene_type:complete